MRRKILPYSKNLKMLARKLRREMTVCEAILWNELKGKQMMGFDFDRQRPIDNYIVDFYCKDLMLAIEVDGITHTFGEVAKRDAIRQKRLEEFGVRFLRFDDDDIKSDINRVLDIIREWIRAHPELVGRESGAHPPPGPSREGGLTGTLDLTNTQTESPLRGGDLGMGGPRRKKDNKFHFKQFSIRHDRSGMKVGTDGTLLGAWTDVTSARHILDIGTGTGLIALMLAQRASHATIDAIEIDPSAIEDVRENFANSPWKDRLRLHHNRAQDFKPSEKFDLIVSNPPYFISSFKPPIEQRVTARHTEHLTFQELLEVSNNLLAADGKVSIVLPMVEGLHFIELAEKNGLYSSRKWTFRTRSEKPIERLLLEFTRKPTVTEQGEILLYSAGEEWSDAYKVLTREFYLKL